MLCPLDEDAEWQHFFPSRRRLRKAHGQQLSNALMECLGSHCCSLEPGAVLCSCSGTFHTGLHSSMGNCH